MNSRVVCSECGEVEEVAVYCGNPDCGEALDDEGQAIPEVVSLREWQNGAQRVSELEGALDDALAEIRVLRAWKERAFHILRECGLQAREILLLVEPETPAPSQADPVDNPGGKL